jgi:hypothetical protein
VGVKFAIKLARQSDTLDELPQLGAPGSEVLTKAGLVPRVLPDPKAKVPLLLTTVGEPLAAYAKVE